MYLLFFTWLRAILQVNVNHLPLETMVQSANAYLTTVDQSNLQHFKGRAGL